MNTGIFEVTQNLVAQNTEKETIDGLPSLVTALQDSVNCYNEAASVIKRNANVAATLKSIAVERKLICYELVCYDISKLVAMNNDKPGDDGTISGTLRKIWTSFRAALNSGDATIVLIEAERADDVIVNKFKNILPQIAGIPLQDKLKQFFCQVKKGRDRVVEMRNACQAS